MKRLLALCLSLLLVIALISGCGTKTPAPTNTAAPAGTGDGGSAAGSGDPAADPATPVASTKDTLTVAYSQDRGLLDPLYNQGFDALDAIKMIYESLWEYDKNANQHWFLATGLDMENDGKLWRIHVREGVQFSNGNPLTAEDVFFSFVRANNRVGEAPFFPELNLDSSKVVDTYTVELVFNTYDSSYVYSIPSMPIFDEESFDEATISSNPIGTGPYKLDEYVVNSRINLSLRDTYWGEMPTIKYLHFKFLAEDAQMTNAISTGAVDVCDVPFQDISYVQEMDGYTVDFWDLSDTLGLYFNTSENSILYNNVDARKAIAMAIDRQAIADIAFSGFATVSRMPCASSCIDATDDMLDYGVYGIGYDPEAAAELAKSAGIEGKTLTISTDGTAASVVIAELIQSDLSAIGVKVDVKNYDAGSWYSVVFDPTAVGDMFIYIVAMPSKSVGHILSAWYQYSLSGAYLTSPFPGQEQYNQLIDGIMSLSDHEELIARNRELVKLQADGLLWFALVDKCSAVAHNSDLAGTDPTLMLNMDFHNVSWTK